MSEKEILISKLLEPGAMFKVTDEIKDSVYPPGSLGFVSNIVGIDDSYQDLAKISAVMIRKGKGGKDRILNSTIFFPVFYVDHEGFNKLLPKEGSKKGYVQIERNIPMAVDVMALNPMIFLGYAVSLSKQIKYMSSRCKHKKWPEAKSHPINIMRRLPDYFEDDPDVLIEKHSTEQFRSDFIMEVRRMASSLVRVQIELDRDRADVEVNAAEFLVFTNKGEFIPKDAKDKENEYKFTDDNAMLKRTLSHHKKLRSNIGTLLKSKKNNKKS